MTNPLEISCQAVHQQLQDADDFLLLDCREPDEFSVASISGAVLVPMSCLAQRAAELEAWRSKPIVVHCHHGGRSLRVTNWLLGQGFLNVKSMAGGIDRWSIEIDPSVPRY